MVVVRAKVASLQVTHEVPDSVVIKFEEPLPSRWVGVCNYVKEVAEGPIPVEDFLFHR